MRQPLSDLAISAVAVKILCLQSCRQPFRWCARLAALEGMQAHDVVYVITWHCTLHGMPAIQVLGSALNQIMPSKLAYGGNAHTSFPMHPRVVT
jgi:hypothetical protein